MRKIFGRKVAAVVCYGKEEGGEVPEVSRRPYLRGASGVDASNPCAGIEALAQHSAVKRCIIMEV
jgi:hypothetical protein